MRKSMKCLLAFGLTLFVTLHVQAGSAVKQTASVLGQTSNDCSVPLPGAGPRAVIDGGSASIIRTMNGFSASISLPTPLSGTYCYPSQTLGGNAAAGPAVPGHPEAFSFWGIYFNSPEGCGAGGCGASDVGGPNCVNAQAGAIKLSGHVTGGGRLHLSGHISTNEDPLIGCSRLVDVLGAEIHLAIAPHGMLTPSLMPTQIQVPPGGGPGYWFPAVFLPVE